MATRSRSTPRIVCWLAVVLGGTLSGCAPLTTGVYAEDSERTVGEVTDDIGITSRVKTSLVRDAEIRGRDIRVETRRGMVRLYGFVPEPALAQRAIDIAAGVRGVTGVESRLVVLEPEA